MTLRRLVLIGLALLWVIGLPLLPAQEHFMYWEGDFSPIALPNIATQDATSAANSTVTLFTTGNVDISANNSSTAELTGPAEDTLITEYKLTFDGDGVSQTGAETVTLARHDDFLVPPVRVTHVPGDDDVEVTLRAEAKNDGGTLANAGTYTATQTLTVTWVGP